MKQKTLYTCEICHTDYSDKEDAKRCEKNHKTLAKAQSMIAEYKPIGLIDNGIPHKIKIKFEGVDGWVYYKN